VRTSSALTAAAAVLLSASARPTAALAQRLRDSDAVQLSINGYFLFTDILR
jgi:hypothetical protein